MFIFYLITYSKMKDIRRYLFELVEIIRCRFEMGVCLSLYPNPASPGEDVEATIRTQIFYNNQKVCLIKNYMDFVNSCKITSEKCKIIIPKDEVKPGIYYAFIDGQGDCESDVRPSSVEPKSKDTELRTLTPIF